MDESSRRDLLGALGTGVSLLLAGCGGRAPIAGRGQSVSASATTAARQPKQTPTEPAEPEFWAWLPAPKQIGNAYSVGVLDRPALRATSLATGTLRPQRYTPEAVHGILDRTKRVVTISTGRVAGGILAGQYDVDAVESGLDGAGLAETGGAYASDRIGVAVDSSHLRWADSPDGPSAVLDALGASLRGEDPSYPGVKSGLRRVLRVVEGRPARFARPIAVDEGPFKRGTFLATGIGAGESGITWTSALAFEGVPTDEAVERYRLQFDEAEDFDRVTASTEGALLVIAAETTVERATAIQPL